MLKNEFEFTLSALLLAICAVVGINAAGPLNMWNKEQRIPYRWDVSTPVPIYTDIGPFEVLPPNPPAGTRVYLRSLDVDDPSTDTDLTIDSNDTPGFPDGLDNRGSSKRGWW